MNVVPYKAEHFWAIVPQPAQAYLADYVTPQHIESLEKECSFTVMADGSPVVCFGWLALYPTRALLWTYISTTAGKHFVGITRIANRLIRDLKFKRLEIEVDCEFEQGHRWARMLGFELEAERLRGHRMDGGDSAIYARIRS
jgi:hypothetical protein